MLKSFLPLSRPLWRVQKLTRFCFAETHPLFSTAQDAIKKTRNIAIIAHVDHGKTTLVDSLLKHSGFTIENQCAMDSNQLEREKGITILAKCTSVFYKGHNINIVDTPGHHDFGGEVERIMGMVDGVCLIICATEGPMTQSKFVLRKALEQNLKPIVIVNKIDRPTARIQEVVNEIFELFCELNCPDQFIDYPLYYASGKNGWAIQGLKQDKKDIQCILDGIIKHIPGPKVSKDHTFSMLITQTHSNTYHGKMILGRINSGQICIGKQLKVHDQKENLVDSGKVTKIVKNNGLTQLDLEKAYPGDIVSIAGFPKSRVSHTITENGHDPKVISCIEVDKPLMGISINVNTSPMSGIDGNKLTFNQIKARLYQEAQNDVALLVETTKRSIIVRGRGDLHIGILLEKLRREGFQLSITPPEIVMQTDPKTGEKLQPTEIISFEIEKRFQNLVMEKMLHRKGTYIKSEPLQNDKVRIDFICSTRALIGIRTEMLNETQGTSIIKTSFYEYRPYSGSLKKNPKGAIVSMASGITTPYALKQLQKFGPLFVKPGQAVYDGLVIGQNNKEQDVEVNPTKTKQVTNVRTTSHDEKVVLVPPKEMAIQEAICYIREDQLLEITPKQIRIRKKELDRSGREKYRREKKNQNKNNKSL